MDDKQAALIATLLFALVVPLSLGVALWLVAKLRRASDRPLFADAAGGVVVPVRRLRRTGAFFSRSENSINPRLQLLSTGVAFKVFKPDIWPFAEIAEVDAPWAPFANRLAIRNRSGARLDVDLADAARARDLLRALPPGVSCTRRAITLRDGAG